MIIYMPHSCDKGKSIVHSAIVLTLLAQASTIHCKKKVSDIPVPSRDVTNQTLPRRKKLNYFRPERVW